MYIFIIQCGLIPISTACRNDIVIAKQPDKPSALICKRITAVVSLVPVLAYTHVSYVHVQESDSRREINCLVGFFGKYTSLCINFRREVTHQQTS